jgi:hypothetical protein
MSEVPNNCALCNKILENDFTTLGSQSYIETLEFLKGIRIESEKCQVCLTCFDKVNFVCSFRTPSKPEDAPKETLKVYMKLTFIT